MRELGFGWFNVVYRVTLADGSKKVLKIAPAPEVPVLSHERGAMFTEQLAIELIRDRTEVPAVPIEFFDASLELCNAPYFFRPFISADDPGELGDRATPDEKVVFQEQVGVLNRQLNEIIGPGFGPLRDPRFPTWGQPFAAMFNNTLVDGRARNVELGWEYAEFEGILARYLPYLDEVTVPRSTELDMWTKAVLFRDGKPVAHIDHERAIYGDSIMEAGFTGLHFPGFSDASAFMRGYGIAGLTVAQGKRRLLYTLHLALIMVNEATYRGFDDPEHQAMVRGNLRRAMELIANQNALVSESTEGAPNNENVESAAG